MGSLIANKRFNSLLWIVISGIIISPVIVYVSFFWKQNISGKTSDWANFATYISALIGVLLAPISAVLIYLTYKNQIEFSKQQQIDTRVQQFENSFFSLLSIQREILKSLKGDFNDSDFFTEPLVMEGDDYIDFIAREINNFFDNFHNYKVNIPSRDEELALTNEETEKKVQKLYSYVYNQRRNELGHYFRHLYHILKYILESGVPNTKKYTDLLQSQMSDNELYILMYNCMSEHGVDKFLPIADKAGIFDNVNSRGLLFDKHKQLFFPNTIFKTNTNHNISFVPLSEI